MKGHHADYNTASLNRKADVYFDYLTDLHIDMTEHPLQEVVPDWCAKYQELELEIIDIIRCSHLWRKSLIEVGSDFLTLKLFREICLRVDHFEVLLCENYWQRTISDLKEKDMAINQLHDDRITLLGKMAASMAHEIRNPLTSIKGFLQLLRTNLRALPMEKADAYLEFIEAECNNMHMQVTGFLSFSKRPIIEEELADTSLKQILEYNLSLLNPRLINENVVLKVDIPDSITLRVQKLAFQQVLNNLLNNGIDALSEVKYEKIISIKAFEDQDHTWIWIGNNGPAIPAELAKTLFAPFVTNKTNGTGLGLAICKQIMTKNNGDISFQSTDRETTFKLSFQRPKLAL
ncbi:sensor histidine kinase [Paenibacillus sp. NPDC056579]|uniref:sensor histidine kinase n=1 Tax=Paenibacillus sp. NPDC056579 TaxID=3345871 RepID=UPI0036C33855